MACKINIPLSKAQPRPKIAASQCSAEKERTRSLNDFEFDLSCFCVNVGPHVLHFTHGSLPCCMPHLINNIQGVASPGEPWLGCLRFGLFRHPASAEGSYSNSQWQGELPNSKSTQPRFARRWDTLYSSCLIDIEPRGALISLTS